MRIGYNFLNGVELPFVESLQFISKNFENISNYIFKYDTKRKNSIVYKNFSEENLNNVEPNKRSWIYEEIFLPFSVANSKIDIFLGFNNNLPLRQPCKTAVIIKDPSYLIFKDEMPKGWETKIKIMMKLSASKKSNKIITFSDISKSIIATKMAIDENKIETIPFPVSREYQPIFVNEIIQNLLSKTNIKQPYFFTTSNKSKRKNLNELLEIFKMYLDANNEGFLIIECQDQCEFEQLNKKNSGKNIYFFKRLNDKEKKIFLNGAAGYITTSLFESTCEDELNAMACGTPVICYETESHKKLLGQNAVFVKKGDKKSFLKMLKSAKDSLNLKLQMKALGIQHAKKHTIDIFSNKLVSIFEKIHSDIYSPDDK